VRHLPLSWRCFEHPLRRVKGSLHAAPASTNCPVGIKCPEPPPASSSNQCCSFSERRNPTIPLHAHACTRPIFVNSTLKHTTPVT